MQDTKIEWATHTFNPWMGCTKVSPACKNCYAERDTDKRFGTVQWGPNGTRVVTSEANWSKPRKWDRDAAASRFDYDSEAPLHDDGDLAPYERPRVFCASLADVFEDWDGQMVNSKGHPMVYDPDGPEERPATMKDVRDRLFRLIDATPNLDWLVLTKRPENVRQMWPIRIPKFDEGTETVYRRDNVWLGTSVENQEQADKRIPELLKCRDLSPVLFLSCEPLLGQVDLRPALWLEDQYFGFRGVGRSRGIDWVIAGGESGPNARPSHPDWFRSLRDQCGAAEVPFLFKQWGEFLAHSQAMQMDGFPVSETEWTYNLGDDDDAARVGKKKAGRVLDGREWNEFPTAFDGY